MCVEVGEKGSRQQKVHEWNVFALTSFMLRHSSLFSVSQPRKLVMSEGQPEYIVFDPVAVVKSKAHGKRRETQETGNLISESRFLFGFVCVWPTKKV